MSRQNIQHITDLLIKHRQNTLSEDERKELNSWINQNQQLFDELNSDEIFTELAKDYLSKKTILTTVKNNISSRAEQAQATFNESTFKKYMPNWWLAAAVVIVLVACSYFWLFRIAKVEPTKPIASKEYFKNDVQPGGNRAKLTLAGGSIIILDSVHSGMLSKEGGANIEKTADGKLAYNSLHEKPTEIQYNTLTTPRGGQYFLELSDGSKVWLNAASSLRYPVTFTGKERKVELMGEAYFEISKIVSKPSSLGAKANPFIVNILPTASGRDASQVEVFGTHFNINAYTDEAEIKTTLLEGSVAMTARDQKVLLKPGQQAQFLTGKDVDARLKVNNDADIAEIVSWKNGITSFKNEDIKSIMRKVSRWYDIDVIYQGTIPERTFMGGIPRNSNLSDLLKVLELSKIHFEIEGKKIIVKP
jgi:transmembrane sensor